MSSRSAERDEAAWTSVIVQEAPHPRRLNVNVERVAEVVAAHPRADLVIFPELYLSGFMEPFAPDHAVYARARAMENGLPHLYANRNGSESGIRFVGESVALDADGGVIASAAQGDAVLEARLNGGSRTDPRTSCLRQRRPGIYGADT